jgi:4'-phosphopantetheinyl transferase
MISRNGTVGIDIEQIKEKVERIASKFLQPQELAFINNDADKTQQLYVCWCVKEAVYKCYGQKEVSFADNILLEPFNFTHHGTVNALLHKGSVKLNYEAGYMQYDDYMIGFVKG